MDLLIDPDIAIEADEKRVEAEGEVTEMQKLIWAEKYRPHSLKDVILPDVIKNSIKYALENDNFQHMIFHSGAPGTGKTTVAKIIPEEYGCEYYFIKTATEGRIDIVENVIPAYGMQKLGNNKPRFVILDEADRVRAQNMEAFYTALQPIIESTTTTLRFILTANHLHRIPEPIRSRCKPISFSHDDPAIKKPMFKRLQEIADIETKDSGGSVDLETLKQIARLNFPDMRAMISSMQDNFNSNNGSITGKIEVVDINHVKNVWDLVVKGDVVDLRKYFTEHISDINGFYVPFLDYVYANCEDNKKLLSFGATIGEHQFRSGFDQVDPELNSNAMFCKMISIYHG